MRVVMLSKACLVGQYQTKLEALAKQPNTQLTVVVPPYWRDERGIIPLERAHTNGYTLLVAPMRLNGQFHFHYYPTFDRILREIQPDLVHIDEEPYNLATFLAARAARNAGAKTIFFTWQNLLRKYPPPFSWMESDVLGHADYAIAGNLEAESVLRAKNYLGPTRVIPQFGVDATQFNPTTKKQPAQFVIGYSGRLVPEKGVDILLRAVAQLDGRWQLRILGSTPDRAGLRALVDRLGIAERVHFDPPRPSVEMPGFYGTLDVFVLASRSRSNWKEQFGRVLIEAMASHVVVVGSASGEIPNVIGDAGLTFREEDVAALRAHLITLRNNPTFRAELGERGRARVLSCYTQSRIAEQTYQVYRELLGHD